MFCSYLPGLELWHWLDIKPPNLTIANHTVNGIFIFSLNCISCWMVFYFFIPHFLGDTNRDTGPFYILLQHFVTWNLVIEIMYKRLNILNCQVYMLWKLALIWTVDFIFFCYSNLVCKNLIQGILFPLFCF